MTSVEIRGTTVIVRDPRRAHAGCDGEELILRLIDANRAIVLCAEKCGQAPLLGCNGHSWFLRNDVVRLPRGWDRRRSHPLPLSAVKVVPARRDDAIAALR